jgi:molecular chaperone GrpE
MNTPENTTTRIDGKAVPPQSEGPGTEGTTFIEQTPARDSGAAAAPQSSADRVAELEAELTRAKDQALRDRADFENTRKRLQREKEEAVRYANAGLLEKLLPVVDNFELGLAAARQSADGSAVLSGMSMVQRQLEDFLRDNGLQSIDATGQKFDPNLHEALGEETSAEVPEGVVLRQLRKGWKLKDRLIRAANVFISKGNG